MKNLIPLIEKYNVWNGQIPDTGFLRQDYLEKINRFTGNNLVKVLVGQRRVGKSYILRQLMNYLVTEKKVNSKNLFFVNKEYTAFDSINTADDLEKLFLAYKTEFKVTGKVYIFLDEVQNIKRWESFVNSYSQDFTGEYEIFITGSNSTLLSGELASLLSGRYVEFEILPFDLKSFVTYKGLEINKETFLTYLQTGGLPELFNLSGDEMKRHYIESLKNTIVLRDIIRRNPIKDVVLLEDIFKFLILNIGNLTSFSNIVKYFKNKQKQTNYETVSTYVGYLTDVFVFHETERYNLQGKQVLGGVRKYYLNDLAFKNYLFGFYPSDIGYFLENYVYLQLKRKGYKIFTGVNKDKEIDFIAQRANELLYVQVTYMLNSEKIIEREFGNLLTIKDNHKKIVISLDEVNFDDYKGIKHIKPWEFI